MKKKLSEVSLFELAALCHKQDSCCYCPLFQCDLGKCKSRDYTPAVSLIKFGDDEIDIDLSIPSMPIRETISQETREEFFEDR